MGKFDTCGYVLDSDGQEWEIAVRVSYDATYEPEHITGLPENCYPATSEMDLTKVVSTNDLPPGITDEMVLTAAHNEAERLEQEAWDDYNEQGQNDEADYYRELEAGYAQDRL